MSNRGRGILHTQQYWKALRERDKDDSIRTVDKTPNRINDDRVIFSGKSIGPLVCMIS
jgi:hypothetical protein